MVSAAWLEMIISLHGSSHRALWLPEPEGRSFCPWLRPLTHRRNQNQLVGKLVIEAAHLYDIKQQIRGVLFRWRRVRRPAGEEKKGLRWGKDGVFRSVSIS